MASFNAMTVTGFVEVYIIIMQKCNSYRGSVIFAQPFLDDLGLVMSVFGRAYGTKIHNIYIFKRP